MCFKIQQDVVSMTFNVKGGEGTWEGDVRLNAMFQFNIMCPHLLYEARPLSLSIHFAFILHRKILFQNRNPDLF